MSEEKDNTKSPLLVLALEGIGFSTSWQGNAIMTASMKNFNNLWSASGSNLLRSPADGIGINDFQSDPLISYSIIASGSNLPKFKSFFDSQIKSDLLKKNLTFLNFLDSIIQYNSCLHLIGTISKKSQIGDKEHLFALIENAKDRGVFRINIHLLLDDTYDKKEINDLFVDIEARLNEIGVGALATISGLNNLYHDKKVDKLFDAIFIGKAKRFLTPAQAIKSSEDDELRDLDPSLLIAPKGGLISDFDGVIFFNHNILATDKLLIEFFKSPHYRKIKFLKKITLLNNYYTNFTKTSSIYSRTNAKKLCRQLSEGQKKSLFIYDKLNENKLKYYLFEDGIDRLPLPQFETNNFLKFTEKSLNAMFQAGVKACKSKQFDLVFISVPYVSEAFNFKDFNTAVDVLKLIDQYIYPVAKEITDSGGQILIFSPYGLAEKYSGTNTTSANPLPYIYFDQEIPKVKKEIKPSFDKVLRPVHGLEHIHDFIINKVNNSKRVLNDGKH